jgi:ribonuclease R
MTGVVTGVTHFGLFVTLKDVFVDGLLHISGLGHDYYHLEPGGRCLKGERTGEKFLLGQDLEVRITRVDVDEGRVDLALPAVQARGQPQRRGPRRPLR